MMVKIERMGDVTLTITAPRVAWDNLVDVLNNNQATFLGETAELFEKLYREITGK